MVNTPGEMLFGRIMIAAVEIKIDYRASAINFHALYAGDYLQCLNMFPLDGLEITLKHVTLLNIIGINKAVNQSLEMWVNDIYENQLYKIISGTAPLRGLSNIGSDIQELLAIPMNDYKTTGGIMRHLRRSTRSLLRTVTRETLHASHQIAMFVANALTELTSDDTVPAPIPPHDNRNVSNNSNAMVPHDVTERRLHQYQQQQKHQPVGVVQGVGQGFESVSREVSAAADTVIAIPVRQYVRTGTGAGAALKSVIRAMPIAILRPVAGVAEGISYTMLGLRNIIDPGARIDEEDRWNVEIGDERM